MRSERRHYQKHDDEAFFRCLSERVLAVITASGKSPSQIHAMTGMYFDRRALHLLREGEIQTRWSKGHLVSFAAALGIRVGLFVEDETFPAAAPAARRAA